LRYSRSMHELDSDTWSRSMVATLGLGIVGASREGWMNTSMVPPQHVTDFVVTRRFEAKLP
jgi:hypothetical protein